jgi:hypothetical protein
MKISDEEVRSWLALAERALGAEPWTPEMQAAIDLRDALPPAVVEALLREVLAARDVARRSRLLRSRSARSARRSQRGSR